MSKWTKHKNRWKDCDACYLSSRRTKVVLARGSIPADILFIGEAPGISEDVLGKPFVGPAGKLLDEIIDQALPLSIDLRYCFTNVVACIPLEESSRSKVKIPPKECIKACSNRLAEFISLVKPKLVVYVGKLAAKESPMLPKYVKGTLEILHPAYLLRLGVDRDISIKKTIINLKDFFVSKVEKLG